ncbi:uncharacterized protein LOC130241490 [Danio aesculapii]|uniref:uncharacterized protein LOC130241490 n=1 Tax=Danio aesculapii TaxID=1142201 RepID=UPI0024BFB5A7|nr:uncharacterized protein LOC130241490 [Danio aesculapii]
MIKLNASQSKLHAGVSFPPFYAIQTNSFGVIGVWSLKSTSAMASTPSASALSAVLRCQRNLLARKQPNKKRPPAAGYGLGMTAHGDSLKVYFRGLIFNGTRVDIPGVLSATARLSQTGRWGKTSLRNSEGVKNTPKTDSRMLTAKVLKTKHMSDYSSAFKSQSYNVLPLPLDGTLRKQNLDHKTYITCRICVVCAHSMSLLNHTNINSLFSHGLLCFLRDTLMYFTTAVADSVRTQLNMNQLHPDCDESSGCFRCTSKHFRDQPKRSQT